MPKQICHEKKSAQSGKKPPDKPTKKQRLNKLVKEAFQYKMKEETTRPVYARHGKLLLQRRAKLMQKEREKIGVILRIIIL